MGALAHVAHWYAELLYVAPVVAVAGWLALSGRRERNRAEPSDGVPGGRRG